MAIYLQYGYDKHFEKDACIDLEYNRDGTGIKRPHRGDDDGWIAPDILLHVRKTDNNIFYCEVKKKSTKDNEDSVRVTDALKERKYQYGVNLYYVRSDGAKLTIYTREENNSRVCVRKEYYRFNTREKSLARI